MSHLLSLLDNTSPLLIDGAIGTSLFTLGLPGGAPPELWNTEKPDTVTGLHRSFVQAGSDIILTNSFGANARRLVLHQADDRIEEINVQAARLARQATSGTTRDVAVLGSVGPTGDLLLPLGALSIEEAEECFYVQALGLLAGGVDGFWIETFSALDECRAAIRGIRRADTHIPIFLSLSFDVAGKTMMGIAPHTFTSELGDDMAALSGVGANCGVGPAEMIESIIAIRSAENTLDISLPHLIAKSNYGVPEFRNGAFRYHGTPQMMAQFAQHCRTLGVKIIGGCCGTTAEIIAQMRQALDSCDQDADYSLKNTNKISEIQKFISEHRAKPAPATTPESTVPSDHSPADKRSAARSRPRRRN